MKTPAGERPSSRDGKQFVYLRIPNADHSLRLESEKAKNEPPFINLGPQLRSFFLGDL
jgi:hypothetical protein